MTEEKDTDLVYRFLDGDESAFNRIFAKYNKRVYWHARKMLGNHLDADEVTQDVFVTIYKKIDSFNFKSSLSTWIYRITSNKSINRLRKRKVKDFFSLEDVENKISNSSVSIEKDIELKEKTNKLDEVLEKLPTKQKEIFVLRHFEELSYKEISDITGRSIGALKANYFHALQKVKEKFDEEE